MPLDSRIVGESGEPLVHEIDARWTMAYAGGLGDVQPIYLDTAARPDVLAHPLFPVCFEWPAFLSARHLPSGGLAPAEATRGVHASHDLEIHQPVRAGMTVTTTATVVAVEARPAGAFQRTRLETRDEHDALVCTSLYTNAFRGVDVAGGDRAIDGGPTPIPAQACGEPRRFEIPIATEAAHVYTECARIWNPIHTDAAVAAAAGLPAIILHGTATLARAVSRVCREVFDDDVEAVSRIAGRFGAMVSMPSTLHLEVEPCEAGAWFTVTTEAGEPAIRDGWIARGQP